MFVNMYVRMYMCMHVFAYVCLNAVSEIILYNWIAIFAWKLLLKWWIGLQFVVIE